MQRPTVKDALLPIRFLYLEILIFGKERILILSEMSREALLREERSAGMVQRFPEELANKLVNKDDWNHYYVRAKGAKVEGWLNGVKTIDTVHEAGFLEGSLGFNCVMANVTLCSM